MDRPKPAITPDLLIYGTWNTLLSLSLALVLIRLSALYTNRPMTQVLFVLAMFYGTYLWYYTRAQSSEIYQALFYACTFLFAVTFLRTVEAGKPRWWRMNVAWLFIGMLVLTRILYVLLIPLVAIFFVVAVFRAPPQHKVAIIRRSIPRLLAGPIVIALLLGLINYVKFGSPMLTGYHAWRPEQHFPIGSWRDGLWGLLLSHRFSIFLYFPILPFALFQSVQFFKRFRIDAIVAYGIAGGFLLMLAKIPTWAGEWTYGPRYMLFVLPILSLPFILFLDRLIDRRRSITMWALACIAAGSVFYYSYLQMRVNQLGFFAYYRIRIPIESRWNDSIAAYFLGRHSGQFADDLLRHSNDLDSLTWFAELKRIAPSEFAEQQRATINLTIAIRNHYWWREDELGNR